MLDRLVEQRLVGDDLAGAAAGRRALTIAFGLGVVDAVRQACAAKPPNTTEWIAPMRAQASIANAASGIIGM